MQAEVQDGVEFHLFEQDGTMFAVMGLPDQEDGAVALIRLVPVPKDAEG